MKWILIGFVVGMFVSDLLDLRKKNEEVDRED